MVTTTTPSKDQNIMTNTTPITEMIIMIKITTTRNNTSQYLITTTMHTVVIRVVSNIHHIHKTIIMHHPNTTINNSNSMEHNKIIMEGQQVNHSLHNISQVVSSSMVVAVCRLISRHRI